MARIRTIKPDDCPGQKEIWDEWSLYIIEEKDTGIFKVGTTWHPKRRISALQAGNPRKLSFKAIFVGSKEDCCLIEKKILSKFASSRLCGEWLIPSLIINVLDSIDALAAESEYGSNES